MYLFCSCAAIMCKCDNGVPESGASCPKSGALKCKSCNDGFYINVLKTKCSGRCPR